MNQSLMAPPYSRKHLENFAEYVRFQLGLDGSLFVPIMQVAEIVIPQFDPTFECSVLYESEMNGEYANYCPQSKTLNVRQDVYEAACSDDPRHRFTIAHELGHYFLHDDLTRFSRCVGDTKMPSYRDPEWQANVFASAFLMSRKMIRGMAPEDVAFQCKTSLQSAAIALQYC